MAMFKKEERRKLTGSFGISVYYALNDRLELIKTQFEERMNARRSTGDDGHHNKFSCRDGSTEMTIPNCVRFMMCMQSCDIYTEMVNFHRFNPENLPSESTYCQVRDKIPDDLLEDLFHWSVDTYYWQAVHPRGVLGLTILAVDGSEDAYPANPKEPDNYLKTRSDTRARNVVHINACCDTDRHMFVDIIPQNAHDKDERSAYYQIMARVARRLINPDHRRNCLFTTDRGYEAWNLPVLADFYGFSFLCRVKSEDSNGVLSGIRHLLPEDRNSFDWNITITLTRDPSKKNLEGYHYLSPNTFCELIPDKAHDYTVTLRVTKIRISDSVTEYLISNLPKEAYSKDTLKVLYHRRWPVETSFSFIKYALSLIAPHASTCIPIIKEMWCRFTMFNICSAIAFHDHSIEKKEDFDRKYDYTRNFSSAIASIRDFIRSETPYDIDYVVSGLIRPVREKEPTERHKTPRKPRGFNHRT